MARFRVLSACHTAFHRFAEGAEIDTADLVDDVTRLVELGHLKPIKAKKPAAEPAAEPAAAAQDAETGAAATEQPAAE